MVEFTNINTLNSTKMDKYCLNRNQQVGYGYNHEVHKSWCSHRPLPANQIDLGYCYSDEEALRKAKQYYSDADGCAYCCPSIHKG